MRARSTVFALPKIAVHAEDLESCRVSIVLQPLQQSCGSALAVSLACFRNLTTVLRAVIENVINAQEFGLGFTAARAHISAVGHDHFMPQLPPPIPATHPLYAQPLWVKSNSCVGLSFVGLKPLRVCMAVGARVSVDARAAHARTFPHSLRLNTALTALDDHSAVALSDRFVRLPTISLSACEQTCLVGQPRTPLIAVTTRTWFFRNQENLPPGSLGGERNQRRGYNGLWPLRCNGVARISG